MGVEGGIAVAVVDDDVVAPGAGIGRGRDRAGLRGEDGRTGRRAEVDAVMPAVLLGQRVDAVAVCVGDRNRVRERVQKASRGRRRTGIGAAVRRNLVVVLPVQLCLTRRFLFGKGVKILGLGLLDLRGHFVLELFVVLIFFRKRIILGRHLQNQLIGLGALRLQRGLLLCQIALCLLQLVHLGF